MKYLYKYPQAPFPYSDLLESNAGVAVRIWNTSCSIPGCLNVRPVLRVFVEYAKAGPEDLLVQITAINLAPRQQRCRYCPQCGFATPGLA